MIRITCILLLAAIAASAQSSPRFTVAATCADCHSALPNPAGAMQTTEPPLPVMLRHGRVVPMSSIGMYSLWQGSAMANSAIDPYWQARARWEARQHPTAAAVIEDTCMHCHAPMQRYEAHLQGQTARLNQMDALGRDGVSCTLCHQILPDRLGTKASFTAEFVINEQKRAFGPHANPFVNPMVMQTGYTPTLGAHITESAMCGSCHTVITPVLNATGDVVGEFVEQAPYLEWLASEYPARGVSCQSCHMPEPRDVAGRPLAQQIATRPNGGFFPQTGARTPFGKHAFTGANVLLSEFMAAITPAKSAVLAASGGRARESLGAALDLAFTTERRGSELEVDVTLRNLTGHKLPTAFPTRRMWLFVRVADANGATLFESGRPDPATGEIVGWDGDPAHRDEIVKPSQVAVYEAILADSTGVPTKSLLSAARMAKDNRLLPAGFRASAALPDGIRWESIQAVGTENDPNFKAGEDRVKYEVKSLPESGALRVTLEVLYQTIRPSEVSGFSAGGSAEEELFLRLFANRKAPLVMARKEGVVR